MSLMENGNISLERWYCQDKMKMDQPVATTVLSCPQPTSSMY